MYKSTVFNTFNRHVPIKKKCIRANVKLRFDIVTATSNVDNFGMYKSTIFNTFNRHLPIKKKYIRANTAVHVKRLMQHFMSKFLHVKRALQNHHEEIKIKVNESQCIALFVVNRSIKKLF